MKKIALLLSLSIFLASCAAPNSYIMPNPAQTGGTTLTGSVTRSSVFSWMETDVLSIDNQPISFSFFDDNSANEIIPVFPNQSHVITIHTTFVRGFGLGPYDSIGQITTSFQPGHHYRVLGAVNGASVKMMILDQTTNQVSAFGSAPYQLAPRSSE